ncbi:hypothetical protein Tco_0584561, partial [Tanacetum coccineum]
PTYYYKAVGAKANIASGAFPSDPIDSSQNPHSRDEDVNLNDIRNTMEAAMEQDKVLDYPSVPPIPTNNPFGILGEDETDANTVLNMSDDDV